MRLPLFASATPRGWIACVAAAIVIVLLPIVLDDPFFILVAQSLAYLFIVALGLDILVGWTGQISLGHAGLFAAGSYTTALLSTRLGVPFWISAPLGVAAAAALGALLALPSLRAKGPYLAMVTVAFGFMAEVTANRWSLTGGPMGIMSIPYPRLPNGRDLSPAEYFWLVGGVALLCQVTASNLFHSRIGRTLFALRGSEIAAETVGVNVYRYKVLAFVVSSVYAGIGGVFFAHQNGFINSDTFVFALSVSFLAAVLMGGTGTLYGPVVGSTTLNLIPTIFAKLHEYHLYIYGGIILVIIVFLPKGIVGSLLGTRWLRGFRRAPLLIPLPTLAAPGTGFLHRVDKGSLDLGVGRVPLHTVQRDRAVRREGEARSREEPAQSPTPNGEPVIEVRGLGRSFGGVSALNQVHLRVMAGDVHGLIGPNGSGKSTFVNVLTGLYKPSAGSIRLDGREVGGQSPHRMARLGVTRTFQSVRLFGDLTVLDNVMVGFHTHLRRGFFAHLLQTRGAVEEEARFRGRAMALLERVGLADRAHELARNLAYGQQRRLEIARALAVAPRVLLLDEPAAGINPTELNDLARIVRDIKAAGITQVVIEHHMELIMGISDVITVLDFGQKIAEGSVERIQRDPKVIEAYLGTPEAQHA